MAVASMERKPLRLKDLLELDCDSCSAAGFRCYPRHLCVVAPPPAARRHEQQGASFRRHPMLSLRSLSRRLRGSFSFSWSRGDDDEEAAPAPAVPAASSSGSSDSESSESSAGRKSESEFSLACSAESGLRAGVATADGHEQHEAIMERGSKEAASGSEVDDGDQLSPVAVMDFPFDDDEDDNNDVEEEGADAACSPSARDSLAQLHQRRNIQLQHKLRRHRSIGEVGAVDLDARFAAADPDAFTAVPAQQPHRPSLADAATAPSRPKGHRSDEDRSLLAPLITGAVSAAAQVSERLLLDFFAEARGPVSSPEDREAALRAAERWIQGAGPQWGLKEVLCGRQDLVAEMDRGRRWSARAGEGEEEEREVGVAVAGLVIDDLVHELVRDMVL